MRSTFNLIIPTLLVFTFFLVTIQISQALIIPSTPAPTPIYRPTPLPTPPAISSSKTCQQISNEYGTWHQVQWGKADKILQDVWAAKKCNTYPDDKGDSNYNWSCQKISDTNGTYPKNWSRTTDIVMQEIWIRKSCTTVPSNSKTCQQISNEYATWPNHSGKADANVQSLWAAKKCNTYPDDKGDSNYNWSCQKISDTNGTYPGNWSRTTDKVMQEIWIKKRCITIPVEYSYCKSSCKDFLKTYSGPEIK
ncbi:MAG: hypothetical protein HQK51_02270 [Oligoflexia bacterium]|nr:hypothetical protein [Oligoflexia bacterium]